MAGLHHAQRAFHLAGEIQIARHVHDVDFGIVPLAGGEGDIDADAPFLLFRVEVRGRGSVVGASQAVEGTRGVQQRLRQGGFARPLMPE